MAAKGRGLYEVRTRVMCHLPVNNGQEEKAFEKVRSYLRGLQDQGIGVTGYTTSTTPRCVPRLVVVRGKPRMVP